MNDNIEARMKHWVAMARPPAKALKQIKGGRLTGMTDVNPQWRYQAMTEQFGPCGIGWTYEIDKLWTEPGADGEVLAFAQVSVRTAMGLTSTGEEMFWSAPVVGVGGNHLIVKESKGLRNNDECWKMAITDALSVALKMLGVAADIYAGLWDGSKYITPQQPYVVEAPPADLAAPPSGTHRIVKVEPQRKGNFEWADVTYVTDGGEEKTAIAKGQQLIALLEQWAQNNTVCELTVVINKKDKPEIEEAHAFTAAPAPTTGGGSSGGGAIVDMAF